MSATSVASAQEQSSVMLTRQQLLHLFNRFDVLTSQPGISAFHSLFRFRFSYSICLLGSRNWSCVCGWGFGGLYLIFVTFTDIKKRIADAVQDKQVSHPFLFLLFVFAVGGREE